MNRDDFRPVEDQLALWFGGDYNPEQWPEEIWPEDLDALESLGANTVTLPVFAWSALQPAKDRFEFGWLDRILEMLGSRGIGVVMATPTAAQPAWMSASYPEILPVDGAGRRRKHGGRVNYCPTSSAYREGSGRIAAALAERYAGYEGLRLWHINNEYGPVCFCDGCREVFQHWLLEKYGDLGALNEAWGSAAWGNTLQDWSEIEFPSQLNAMASTPAGSVEFSPNPGISLDHSRFVSWVLLQCFLNEKEALRERTPRVPITTNFHGPVQAIDWHEWGSHVDLVSWDSYPDGDSHWSTASFGHDLARGAGPNPEFLLMETSPGPTNWHPVASLKSPGTVRLQALQAVARGSRGALFFQVRQSRSGNELNHSALIPRHGRLDTRMGEELMRLGRDLRQLGVPPESHRLRSRVAVVFDWPSWWAHHAAPGLDQRSRYLDTVRRYHRVLAEHNVVVDVVGSRNRWDGYDVVVAPALYLVDSAIAGSLLEFVQGGGLLITTVGSGIVDSGGRVHSGGVEETWRRLVGVWVEETDARLPEHVNPVVFDDGATANASELFDLLRLDTAEPVAHFQEDFYAGSPAVTVNRLGQGTVIYLASPSPEPFAIVVERFLGPSQPERVPASVECVKWEGDRGELVFLLNHGEDDAEVGILEGPWTDLLTDRLGEGGLILQPGEVLVAKRSR
jgi:beta-galactosidase